jgi:hypothetical protein
MNTITYDNWETTYIPQQNKNTEDGCFNNTMYETYGNDIEFVMTQPQQNTWTLVETDNGETITNGFHLVNRIAYFITEKPWSNDIDVDLRD